MQRARRNAWSSASGSAGSPTSGIASLEITPLIDVVFLLLTFFIFALILTTRVDVTEIALPPQAAAAGAAEQAQRPLIVELDDAGRVSVTGLAIANAADPGLAETLSLILDQAGRDPDTARLDRPIVVAADVGSRSGDLLLLMDALAALGETEVRFWRRERTNDAPTTPATTP